MANILYLLLLFGFGVYSYSQIDLNLTLFQFTWFLDFQKAMIWLGYFDRPLSMTIFILLIILLVFFYLFFIKNGLTIRKTLILIGGIILLGLFSYPAYSHDLFNAMFYPRIIFEHNSNPYLVTALNFPNDTWTRFMQWTHNTYQWGPLYLILTIPFYLLGFGKFILTLFSFKAMTILFYLGSCYFIYRFAGLAGLIMFTFNPLVIVEAVVAGHLDIVMVFFMLGAVYLVNRGKIVYGGLSLFASIGVKFVTVFLFPVILFWSRLSKNVREIALVSAAFFGGLVQVYFRDLLPHYFLVYVGVVSLFPSSKRNVYIMILLTVVMLLVRYIPFLYLGYWLPIHL